MKKLAIIILNYCTFQMTVSLTDHLSKICPDDMCEIIVVDNASPNESAKELEAASENGEKFVFLKNAQNSGYAAGNNVGLKYAAENGFAYSLVINNDIEIENFRILESMIRLMDENEKIGAVSPRIVGKDKKKDPPIYFKKPTFWDLSFGIRANQKQRYAFDEKRNVRIYAPRGSCMLLRNSALKQVDYLDEYTFLYYEEPILAERLEAIHSECWLCGSSVVIHNHAVTIKKAINKKKIIDTVARSYRYYLSEYRKFNWVQVKICVLIRRLAIAARR